MEALLMLEDGKTFRGKSLGWPGISGGEVVFNTGMTGYQEILTDPSYRGQMVVLTYPLVGNYGINESDEESGELHLSGLIIRQECRYPSHWQAKKDLDRYLKDNRVVGISDIDTRALTRHIRSCGSMFGVITTISEEKEVLFNYMAREKERWHSLVTEVSTREIIARPAGGPRVIVMDFGCKNNIINKLAETGVEIIVVPHDMKMEEMMDFSPAGILLANGPGDPRDLPGVVDEIEKLLGKVPLFGICLGHQLLAMALGGKVRKMKFGHHGCNHPVKDIIKGSIDITSQNHGYAVSRDGLPPGVEVTHINLNDNTIEGLRQRDLKCFSLQYHPEAAPGPQNPAVFTEFVQEYVKGEMTDVA